MARLTTSYRLLLVGGELDVQEIPVQTTLTFGRGRDADVRLTHPLVSRQHCRLQLRGDQLVVHDLGSLNGTYVGSQRLDPFSDVVLPAGGLLSIGTVTFRAVADAEHEGPTSEKQVAPPQAACDTAVSIEDTVRNPGDGHA